jgi:hypothetical protein
MKKRNQLAGIFIGLMMFMAPALVLAQAGPLEYTSYTVFGLAQVSDFCQLIEGIWNLLFAFLIVAAFISIVVAGYLYSTAGVSPSNVNTAKGMLAGAIVGLLLGATSYMVLNTIQPTLVTATCEIAPIDAGVTAVTPNTGGGGTAGVGVGGGVGSGGNTGGGGGVINRSKVQGTGNMVDLSNQGVNVANWYGINGPGRTDRVDAEVARGVVWMQQEGQRRYGVTPFQVTAAYTAGVGHSAGSQHYNGVAVDFEPINGVSNSQVAQLAREAGFTYVLDEGNHIHADVR